MNASNIIAYKTGVGAYAYGTKPNAVTSVTGTTNPYEGNSLIGASMHYSALFQVFNLEPK